MARVAVVEDNAELLALFTHTLIRAGHAVTPYRSAVAALDQIREHIPDLVITDFDMPPGMTGLDLAQALTADPATSHIPVIMITGSVSTSHDIDQTVLARYLGKPVLPSDLVRHVHDVLTGGGCRSRA